MKANRISIWIIRGLLISLPFVLTGCPEAYVKCGADIQKFHCNMGTINLPLFPLGQILSLHKKNKRAYYCANLKVTSNDITSGDTADKESATLSTNFDISVSSDVPQTAKAAISTAISKGTRIILVKTVRVNLSDCISLLNNNKKICQQLIDEGNDPNVTFAIVSTQQKANKVDVQLDSKINGYVDVNVINVAGINVKINYQCTGMVGLEGKQTGVFYGVTYIKYDPSKKKFVRDYNQKDHIWEYDVSSGMER